MKRIYISSVIGIALFIGSEAQAMAALGNRFANAGAKALQRSNMYQSMIRKNATEATKTIESPSAFIKGVRQKAPAKAVAPSGLTPAEQAAFERSPYLREKILMEKGWIKPPVTPPAPTPAPKPAPAPATPPAKPVTPPAPKPAPAPAPATPPAMPKPAPAPAPTAPQQTVFQRWFGAAPKSTTTPATTESAIARFKNLPPKTKAMIGAVGIGAAGYTLQQQKTAGLATIQGPLEPKVMRLQETEREKRRRIVDTFIDKNDLDKQIKRKDEELNDVDQEMRKLGEQYRGLLQQQDEKYAVEYRKIFDLDQEGIEAAKALGQEPDLTQLDQDTGMKERLAYEARKKEYNRRNEARKQEIRRLKNDIERRKQAAPDARIKENQNKRDELLRSEDELRIERSRLEQLKALGQRLISAEDDKLEQLPAGIIEGLNTYMNKHELTPELIKALEDYDVKAARGKAREQKERAAFTRGLEDEYAQYLKDRLPRMSGESDEQYKQRRAEDKKERRAFLKQQTPQAPGESDEEYKQRIQSLLRSGIKAQEYDAYKQRKSFNQRPNESDADYQKRSADVLTQEHRQTWGEYANSWRRSLGL